MLITCHRVMNNPSLLSCGEQPGVGQMGLCALNEHPQTKLCATPIMSGQTLVQCLLKS